MVPDNIHINEISKFSSFNDVLDRNAIKFKDKIALTTLDREGNESEQITYGELTRISKAIAARLLEDCVKGDTCLILAAPGIDFTAALLACFYSGIIAVPAQPPKKKKRNERLHAILKDADPACVLVSQEIEDIIRTDTENFSELLALPRMLINSNTQGQVKDHKTPRSERNDVALLQYTSGTTGKPNGTMISHAGILHNSELIKKSFGHTSDLVVVTWLPPYHDMGLIGTLLQPMYAGGSNVIIDPYDFLRDPGMWLRAITKYKGTTAGCPNFALDLLVERVTEEKKEQIDLSTLNVFFCGSEPVRTASVRRFSRHFSDCGFKEKMFLPCYGLAENTLMASGIGHEDMPRYIRADREKLEKEKHLVITNEVGGMSFVSCGHTWLNDKLIIVDPDRRTPLEDDRVGEIWLMTGSIAPGYWKQGAKSRDIFHARVTGTNEGPFLRTGDLGFIHDGHLYIAGRTKDLIIIRGNNYYSTDIANTVEHSHPALQSHACAAFPVNAGSTEKLVVVQEIKRTAMPTLIPEEVIDSIRTAVATEHEIPIYAIGLLSPGRICKTSSGKIQHGKCRVQWEEGSLKTVYSWKQDPASVNAEATCLDTDEPTIENIKNWLIMWLSDKVKINPANIDPGEPILSYGLDSMGAVELEREARERFGIEIHPADFMDNNNINSLARMGVESILKKTG